MDVGNATIGLLYRSAQHEIARRGSWVGRLVWSEDMKRGWCGSSGGKRWAGRRDRTEGESEALPGAPS